MTIALAFEDASVLTAGLLLSSTVTCCFSATMLRTRLICLRRCADFDVHRSYQRELWGRGAHGVLTRR